MIVFIDISVLKNCSFCTHALPNSTRAEIKHTVITEGRPIEPMGDNVERVP